MTPPFPNVGDAFWLSAYPLVFATFAMLARPWLRRAPRAVALETALVGLGMGALVTAFVLPWVLGNASHLSSPAQVVNLAYPLADCVLFSVAVIGATVAGLRGSLTWPLIALGSVFLVVADGLWTLQAANGTWAPVMSPNALYPLWPACAALAAWLPERRVRRSFGGGTRTHAAALVAAASCILLLVANEWVDVPAASVLLAALALAAAVHRTVLALAVSVRETRAAGRERDIVDDVREALDHGELTLHYQPLVDTNTGAVKGAEALLRWYRDGAFVPPDHFLGAVERSPLIRALTDFVLDRALETAAQWWRDGRQIGISVNLATANLSEADLPGRVLHALCRHGLPAHALTLEITETAAISSLVRLARFPIAELKIDRTFVREMLASRQPIVATAVQLAHSLGLRVVAEGVEDFPTLEALQTLGCDLAQGYHFSRPLPAAEFAAWLRPPTLV